MTKIDLTHQNFLLFLQRYKEGDEVTAETILNHMTSWSSNTFKDYISKRKLAPFIQKNSSDRFVILKNGIELSYEEVSKSLTQENSKIFTPIKGVTVQGESSEHTFLSKMGAGAIGDVWKGTSIFMGSKTDSAIKYLSPREDLLKATMLADIKKRFKREAMNGRKLVHDNIIKIQDYGEHEDTPFLTMELAEKSVAKELKEKSLFMVEDSFKVINSCLDGLHFLHSQELVHRDIKPANILLTNRGYVIGDLGIIKWTDFDEAVTKGGSLTNNSMQLGSWYYMAPEQRDSPKDVFKASDIYALGVTWYEMLTGKTLDPTAVGAKKFPNTFKNERIYNIISKMLNYEPNDRPTIEEIRLAIKG